MYTENGEIENYDYIRECISNLESKDSGVNLSSTSTGASDISLQGNSLDDVNLGNIDFNFIKIENLLLQNVEESENCAKSKEVKQEKSAGIDIPDSIEDFDTVSLGYNTFSNFSDSNSVKQSDDVSTVTSNNESHAFDKDLTSQCLETEQHPEGQFHDCPVKPVAEDNNGDVSSNAGKDSDCAKRTVSSEAKHGIKVDNVEQSDGDGQVQTCEQCLMTFRYKRHLDRHLEGHVKNNCPHCNEKFARRKHLEVHLFRAHGERIVKHPYLCDVCPRSFPKRALLNRHRAKHNYQSGRVCSECGDMIQPDVDEKEHEENHCRKKQFRCEQCSQTFSIEQTYLSHIQNHNNHKCPNCDVSFASKKKAHEHLKAVHTPKSSEPEATNSGEYQAGSTRSSLLFVSCSLPLFNSSSKS